MADENKTQWTDTNYSEDESEEQESYEYEDADSEEGGSQEYEDEEYAGEDAQEAPQGSRFPAVMLLLIILVLICLGVFFLFKHLTASKGGEGASDGAKAPAAEQVSNSDDSFFGDNQEGSGQDMMSLNFNDENAGNQENAGGVKNEAAPAADADNASAETAQAQDDKNKDVNAPSDIFEASENAAEEKEKQEAALAEEKEQDEILDTLNGSADDSIMVAWNRAARQNPFRPPVFDRNYDGSYEQIGNLQFEIIEPPTKLVPDENLTKLLQTQISGIMYDDESPSAIVNLAGVDQFVKIGDVVSGYKIKNITNTKVEISYKNNTYVASVGELFTRGKLEAKPAVSNLKNKFAGRYKKENIEE